MKFTVQYIPLDKINNTNISVKITERLKRLQGLMWDCMYILIVKENRKDGDFTLVSGRERLEYLRKYTKNIYAPCIIDKKPTAGVKYLFHRFCNKQSLDDYPLLPISWSIVRTFLKQEPRFNKLSRCQQIKVLFLGARYKKTVILSMQNKVECMLRKSDL